MDRSRNSRLADPDRPSCAVAGSLELWGGVECTVARVGDRYTDELATTGHDARPADLELFARLGIRALRYPVLWERIAPDRPDRCDWSWTDARLARLRELGIRPVLGLVHHGSGPRYTELADPHFPRKLADFAARVAERYPWAEAYTPINEPLTTARFSGLYGHWYPHARDFSLCLSMLVNEIAATRLAMSEIRAVNAGAELVQTEDLGQVFATRPLQYQADFENERRWLTWDLLAGRVDAAHPLYADLVASGVDRDTLAHWCEAPCPPDVIGVNHYLTSERFLDHRHRRYEAGKRGGNGQRRYADVEARRVLGSRCAGPEQLLRETWERYRLPLAVTEAHNGCTRDEQMRWFAEVWAAAAKLRAAGVDLRAVTAWSLLGATDWNSLLTRETGFYETGVFDVRAPAPRPTAMVGLLRELAEKGECDHPVLDSPGWWHRVAADPRASRRWVSPASARAGTTRASGASKSRSLLVIGARGTLGQALARACLAHALPHHLLAREDLDIADAAAVRRVLSQLKPWAVINAAGCVDVDRAERDVERCWRDNCTGAEQLCKGCAELGIAFVTFSSDLVFDGGKGDAYHEGDAVFPLNVYGKSKAAAERAVLSAHERSLVIRTSAFFGSADRYNFARQTLERLAAGGEVAAVDGVAVSPTFIPDLVERTLDLLIDGETGIWHLANGGAISWYAFARELAQATGMDPELVRAAAPDEAGWIAQRPSNSALTSGRGSIMPPFESAFARFIDEVRGELALP